MTLPNYHIYLKLMIDGRPCWSISKQSAPSSSVEAGRDRYQRTLTVCYAGEVDLNGAMVQAG